MPKSINHDSYDTAKGSKPDDTLDKVDKKSVINKRRIKHRSIYHSQVSGWPKRT